MSPETRVTSSLQIAGHWPGPESFRSFSKNATLLCNQDECLARAHVLGLFWSVCVFFFSSPFIMKAVHDKQLASSLRGL